MEVNLYAEQIHEKYPDFTIALGNEIYLTDTRDKGQSYYHFILIAKDEIGYTALRKLSSMAWYNSYYDRGMERVPTLKSELSAVMREYKGHVIASTACFQKGTKVKTKNGDKNIEDITDADFVLNQNGVWEKVNFPTSRDYIGEGREITFFENGNNNIRCTDNHQFLVSSKNWSKTSTPLRWVEAKNLCLTKGGQKNYCLFPINANYTGKNIIYRQEWEKTLRQIDYSPKYSLPDAIEITPELMRLFGLWLGDGYISITKRVKKVGITFSDEEFEYYWNDFVQKASETLRVKWSIVSTPSQHKVDIISASVELVELFYYLFGLSHAKDKHVPTRLKNISEELDWNLFFGYALADGYFRTQKKDGYSYGEFAGASISKQLILDIKEILQSLGIRSSLVTKKENIDKNGVHHNESYYLTSSNSAWMKVNKKNHNTDILNILKCAQKHDEKKHFYYKGIKYKKVYIKSIQKIKLNEKVYCLNDNSHSFCCEGVIVHNCIAGQASKLLLTKAQLEKSGLDYENIENQLEAFIDYCIETFGKDNFFIECAPSTTNDQIQANRLLYRLAQEHDLRLITATDTHYLSLETRFAHKAYLNSKDGEREVDSFYEFARLMSEDEARSYLRASFSDDVIDNIFENTEYERKQITNYSLKKNQRIPTIDLPEYPIQENILDKEKYPVLANLFRSSENQERCWINECWKALNEKHLQNNKEYIERLETEADVIDFIGKKLGTCLFAYFNTFKHYIDLFWECGSIVGPGRGSATGFLSNYLLGITQLDPIRWRLPWFRFLNKERAELPD